MPLARRASLNFENMNLGVSYRINEEGSYLQDASNVCSNQGRFETRRGTSRYNAIELASAPLSLSYYKKPDSDSYLLAKCGTSIYSVSKTASHTQIKSGLGATTKHRSITANGRCIIACGGLYTWNGTTFVSLGQDVPTVPDSSADGGGGTLPTATYYVAYTYYSTSTGQETNISAVDTVAITSGEKITFNAASPVASNTLFDKIRVYLRSGTGSYLFIEEIACGATPSNITASAVSTQIPPTTNGLAPSTGKYLSILNSKLLVTGVDSYESDVFISEEDQFDMFDNGTTSRTLNIAGDGPIMGPAAIGFFNNSVLEPYAVIFKYRQTYIYAELNGEARLSEIDSSIGCIAPDSIQVINGNVYFMSESGYRVIIDGKIAQVKNIPVTLAMGAIDDIFNSPGFAFELNKKNASNFHSVYVGREKRYITFVSDMPGNDVNKAYAYEIEYGGFKPYNFGYNINCSCRAENTDGEEIALFGTDNGFLLSHSDSENRSDVDLQGNALKIDAFAAFSWIKGKDLDASYNFRKLIISALVSNNEINGRFWTDYSFNELTEENFDVSGDDNSFILDVSKLDEGILGSGRAVTTQAVDVNRRGKNICIGFYQSILDGNLGIINLQLDYSKNGNRN